MSFPIHLAFRNMTHSDAVATQANEQAEKLAQFFAQIIACHVTVEPSARRHRQGKLYHVAIRLTVPGRQIVVDRDPPEHHAHEEIAVAIHDAFDAMRRKLQDYTRTLHGHVKTHEEPAHGHIVALFPDHGFIRTTEGDEIYMHRNSLTYGRYEDLKPGDEVRYVVHDGEGEKGPQASSVTPIGKHHPAPAAP